MPQTQSPAPYVQRPMVAASRGQDRTGQCAGIRGPTGSRKDNACVPSWWPPRTSRQLVFGQAHEQMQQGTQVGFQCHAREVEPTVAQTLLKKHDQIFPVTRL